MVAVEDETIAPEEEVEVASQVNPGPLVPGILTFPMEMCLNFAPCIQDGGNPLIFVQNQRRALGKIFSHPSQARNEGPTSPENL